MFVFEKLCETGFENKRENLSFDEHRRTSGFLVTETFRMKVVTNASALLRELLF